MPLDPKLILASGSPRRKELLTHITSAFEVMPSSVDESVVLQQYNHAHPQVIVSQLALAKARDIANSYPLAVVIGADTVVVIDGEILGKPIDADDARVMLRRLSGRTHEVYTGIAVVNGLSESTDSVLTYVTFKQLSDLEIEAYVSTGEPMDKAGSYGIQNPQITPVASIIGDYHNVMGLPLQEIRSMLLPYYPDLPAAATVSREEP